MTDDITLKQVRMIMEQIARQPGRSLPNIEINEVRTLLGKGNNGTIGAYIKQIKFEYIESNAFERHELATEFKAATMSEFNRLLDNRTKCLADKCDVINRDNDELLKAIDKAEADNQALRTELQAVQKDAADRATQFGAELAGEKNRLTASESARVLLEADIAKTRAELAERQDEVKGLTAKLARAEADNDMLVDGRRQAEENLRQAQKNREEAARAAALAEQAAAHGEEMIAQLRQQNESLERDVADWKARATEAEHQRDEAQGKLLQGVQNRLDDLTRDHMGTDGSKKAAARPPKRKHHLGPKPQKNQPEA